MDDFTFLETTALDDQQKLSLMNLWNSEYPVNLAYNNFADFENYLYTLTEVRHILLVDETKSISGWAFAFVRDNERWFAILLSKETQGRGLGKLLLDRLTSQEQELSGWVIDHSLYNKTNGQKYQSPLKFYEKYGFSVLADQRLENEKLNAVKIKWMRKG